jgi:hypothetical protein
MPDLTDELNNPCLKNIGRVIIENEKSFNKVKKDI